MDNFTDAEVLQFLVEHDMIDRAIVLKQIEMAKRKELLEQHPFKIWQGKSGEWFTYVPADNKRKRRLIKKTTRKKVEDVIVECYVDDPTVADVFQKWIDYKMHYGEISESTRDRYVADFHRYFDDTAIKKKKIRNVTEEELEEHIKDQIIIHNLTSKAYGGLRTIIIGVWTYAKKYNYSEIAIRSFFGELRLSTKMFAHKSQLDADNVFTNYEIERLTRHLLENDPNVISYGILLGMRTGLRVGELVSLRVEDVSNHCLKVCKTETRHRADDNSYVREVKDNAKTEAGNRYVLIDDEAMALIEKIRWLNPNGEYLFEINGKRCRGQSFTRKLERACNTIGIKPRSMHKCRKTYITTLINENVPDSLIIAQVGHTNIKTSRQFYLYNNKAKHEAIKTLSNAISKNVTLGNQM